MVHVQDAATPPAPPGRVAQAPSLGYIGDMDLRIRLFPTLTSRYILRALAGPFVFSLVTVVFILLLQFVMRFIDQLVGKGLSAWVIIEVIVLNLAWIVVLAVPMSVLVATLMAFGELSSRNEITAMKASGLSIYRMMRPVLVASLLIAGALVFFNNRILPEANHRARVLATDIRRTKPTLTLVAGMFSQDIQGYSILVRKTFENSNDLEGITLYDHTDGSRSVTVTAERGRISFTPDFRKLVMDLETGEIHELSIADMSVYRRLRFDRHRITMDVSGFDFERSAEGAFSRGDRELSALQMMTMVDSLSREREKADLRAVTFAERDIALRLAGVTDSAATGIYNLLPAGVVRSPVFRARQISSAVSNELFFRGAIDRQIDTYMVEIHKKYSIPAACVVFVLIGLPLGVMARRGGFGVAATLSLGFFVLYWACLIGGEKLADRGIVSPFWGMWLANILLGLLGLYLTVRVGREAVFIRWDSLRRLVPRRWRTAESGTDFSPAGAP